MKLSKDESHEIDNIKSTEKDFLCPNCENDLKAYGIYAKNTNPTFLFDESTSKFDFFSLTYKNELELYCNVCNERLDNSKFKISGYVSRL